MDFVFTGFKQDSNFRHLAFDGVGEDRKRTHFVVGADLVLIRKYQITIQELPLLCLRLLEGHPDGPKSVTFTEENMRAHAADRIAARETAAARRKPVRNTPSPNVGAAWRGSLPATPPQPLPKAEL